MKTFQILPLALKGTKIKFVKPITKHWFSNVVEDQSTIRSSAQTRMVTHLDEEHTKMTTPPPASLFKIWNKTLRRYDDPSDYALRCEGYALSYDWHNDDAKSYGPAFHKYAVQLFSGLFDIDRNPIYDGDYLADPAEQFHKVHDMYFIYEVGLYCGSYRKPYIYKAFSKSDEVHVVGRVNCEDALDFSKLRIIGSIHETPLNVYR